MLTPQDLNLGCRADKSKIWRPTARRLPDHTPHVHARRCSNLFTGFEFAIPSSVGRCLICRPQTQLEHKYFYGQLALHHSKEYTATVGTSIQKTTVLASCLFCLPRCLTQTENSCEQSRQHVHHGHHQDPWMGEKHATVHTDVTVLEKIVAASMCKP